MKATELAAIVADESRAFTYVESLRWPNGKIVCPKCGNHEKKIYAIEGIRTKPSKKHPKGKERFGLKKCGSCRQQFTVRVGTIFEDSPIALGSWILAINRMCSSKKGISANQLKRELGISYQSAWFLCHRVREAMKQEPLAGMLGGGGGIVEVDETYIGGKPRNNLHRNKTKAAGKKTAVLTLIDRKGDAVTMKIPNAKRYTLHNIIKPVVDKSAIIVTDAHLGYKGLGLHFKGHETVDHGKEFVRGLIYHTNFAESYHSLFKRGVIGTFHHISEKHMERYLREFECRWNTRRMSDSDRTNLVIQGAAGKRLMLKNPLNA